MFTHRAICTMRELVDLLENESFRIGLMLSGSHVIFERLLIASGSQTAYLEAPQYFYGMLHAI